MPNDLEPLKTPEPQQTGALLVLFKEGCESDSARGEIERCIGRKPACSSAYAGHAEQLSQLLRSEGMMYFQEFGVAILDPRTCHVEPDLIETLRGSETVASIRPEYYMYASGWLCRLLGLEKKRPEATKPATAAAQPAEEPVDPAAAAVGPEVGLPTKPAPQPSTEKEAATMLGEATWGVRAVGAEASSYTGEGVKLAVLDTGIDLDHPDFAGRRIVSQSFVGGSAQDGQGHGTHTAGTAAGPLAPAGVARYGVAYGAELYVGKVLDDSGAGREGDILAGVVWALQSGCQVISMSLGRRPLPGDDQSDYERIGKAALDQGALIIAAAGNDSQRSFGVVAPVSAPANAPSVMAVAAVDEDLQVAGFSNGGLHDNGGEIDISGPGVDVMSAVPGGGHRAFSGTSMATPHVAGVAALLAQSDSALRGRALWEALTAAARDIGLPKQDGGAGLTQAPQAAAGA